MSVIITNLRERGPHKNSEPSYSLPFQMPGPEESCQVLEGRLIGALRTTRLSTFSLSSVDHSAAINVPSQQDTKVATLPFTSMKGPSAFAAATQGPEH